MYIYYKYTPTMFVVKKSIKQFMTDFMHKHFLDFLDGKVGLYISPQYTNRNDYLQLTFDLDAKRGGIGAVIRDAKFLLKLFDNDMEIVTTNNGLHMLTNKAWLNRHTVLDVHHMFRAILASRCKTLDWGGSLRITPFGRLGAHPKGVYMNPVKKLTEKHIKEVRDIRPGELMSQDEWIDYFNHRLIPKFVTETIDWLLDEVRDKL